MHKQCRAEFAKYNIRTYVLSLFLHICILYDVVRITRTFHANKKRREEGQARFWCTRAAKPLCVCLCGVFTIFSLAVCAKRF